MKEEWKVEWVDADGDGHVTEFRTRKAANAYAVAVARLAMMLDVYRREVGEWERNPR